MSRAPKLPDYVAPPYVAPREVLSRATAPEINKATAAPSSVTLAGFDEVIPFTFGEDRVNGLWLVRPYTHIGTGRLRFAILWGEGPVLGPQEIYINGEPVPGSVVMTHYTGTGTQPIDPTLQADIPGFADRYLYLAYTVFSIPTSAITGFPQTARIECVLRGLLTYDERTDTTYWNENPALAMSEWIRSSRFGPGLEVYGTAAVADLCDSIVAGVEPRCRMGMTFSTPSSIESILDLFSFYAECFWSYSGDGILLVPDAAVDPESISVIQRKDIVAGSLRLTGQSLSSSPTQITGIYKMDTGTKEQWPESSITQYLPGVEQGEVQAITSDVTMTGLRRASEVNRKLLYRLNRLQRPGRYAWQMFDVGVKYQQGDVVQLPNVQGMVDEQVRILSAERVSNKTYQFTGEKYDPANYPHDYIPGDEVLLPVGAIIPFAGSTVPEGFELFTDANNRFILGAGAGYSTGTTGGQTTVPGWSGRTNFSGLHSGSRELKVYGHRGTAISSVRYGEYQIPYAQFTPPNNGDHDHSLTVPQSGTVTPPGRRSRWIKKTGLPGEVPQHAEVMANGNLISNTLTLVAQHIGRLALCGTSNGDVGTVSVPVSATVGSTDFYHDHATWWNERLPSGSPTSGALDYTYDYIAAGSVHNHEGNLTVRYTTVNARRKQLAFFSATTGSYIIPGCIVGFDPLLPIPDGWHICDGTNGTVDLRGFFIERALVADAGKSAGNNTVTYTGISASQGSHGHAGTYRGYYKPYTLWWHGSGYGSHTHSVSGTRPFIPPYYAMLFIQYTGAEE